MKFSIVNKSTKVSPADFHLMVEACKVQMKEHVGKGWDKTPWEVEEGMGDGYTITVLDDADHAGALGYHTETPDGKIWGRVFAGTILKAGGTMLNGGMSVSATLSHEVIEAFVDPNVNLWADRGDDILVALEACDPVERDSYEVEVEGHKVSVSNFVLPDYFDMNPAPTAKFDYLGKVSQPFTMTKGGYLVLRDKSGKVTNLFASLNEQDEHNTFKPPHPASRTARKTKDRQ